MTIHEVYLWMQFTGTTVMVLFLIWWLGGLILGKVRNDRVAYMVGTVMVGLMLLTLFIAIRIAISVEPM